MSTTERPDLDLLELAYPYAIDAVSDAERAAIEARRERADRFTAAEFDATVVALRDTLADLTTVDSVPPPAELEGRLLRALDRVIRAAGGGFRIHGGLGPFSRLDWFAAAVVLVIALGAGIGFVVQRPWEPTGSGEVTAAMIERQPDAVTRTAPITGGGELLVRSSAVLGAAAVDLRDVPVPPVGRCYQIWLVELGGEPRSAAVVDALSTMPVVTGFRLADTLAVTVEPSGGSPEPTTTPVVSLNLT
ncbi:anti-sigma factor domain-containing protein [Nocardia sp. CC227C]|uniref:anti-sigma factor n=1 Tax=Nocardia sp. CC227C TaxID=3044562 RepID=UPI00278BC600|nr:anti-sigma factor [Nocardia sp. CC227C]